MKIAFISTNNQVSWGGSEELWCKTAIELSTQGHQVSASVAEWNPRPLPIQQMVDIGVGLYFHHRPDSPLKKIARKFIRLILGNATLFWYPDYRQFLKAFQPELVVISQGSFGQALPAIKACMAANTPFVTVTQLVGEYHALSDDTAAELMHGLKHARLNFFLCNANVKLASRLVGASIPNARLVLNPYKRLPSGLSIPFPATDNSLVLACVASLSMVHKGQDNILEILALPKWKTRNIQINFYGCGPNEQILRRLTEAWELTNIRFNGYVESLEEIWSECSALILASHMEGLPIVVIEAMFCRRAVIAPVVGVVEELIQDHKTGFLAKSSNIYHLEEALENAWNNRDRLEQMGEHAFQLVKENLPNDPASVFADLLLAKD